MPTIRIKNTFPGIVSKNSQPSIKVRNTLPNQQIKSDVVHIKGYTGSSGTFSQVFTGGTPIGLLLSLTQSIVTTTTSVSDFKSNLRIQNV